MRLIHGEERKEVNSLLAEISNNFYYKSCSDKSDGINKYEFVKRLYIFIRDYYKSDDKYNLRFTHKYRDITGSYHTLRNRGSLFYFNWNSEKYYPDDTLEIAIQKATKKHRDYFAMSELALLIQKNLVAYYKNVG